MDIVTYALLKKQIGDLSKSIEAISEGMTFKGSVPTESDLPSNPGNGDLYIIEDTGTKAVWDGSKWIKFDNSVEVNIEPLDGSIVVEGTKVGVKISAVEDNVLELKSDGLYVKKVEGGGSGELESDLIVSNPIGKYAMDEVIPEGTGFEAIFRGLLSKTYYPTLTDPSATITYSVPTLVKVGANVSSATATINFNRGSINPKYTAESQYRSGEVTGYRVVLSGASIEYDETKQTNQFSIPSFTKNNKGNVTITATVSYAKGVQPKDSDGNNYDSPLPAGSKSSSKNIEFILPFYYGASNTADVTSLAGLTEDLSKKGNKTYKITTDDQYLTIAYDSSYGDLTSILDANNFELIEGWTKTTKTIDGQSYNVWVANESTTDTNAQFIFKF